MIEGPTQRQQNLIGIEHDLAQMDSADMQCWLRMCELLETVRGQHLCGEASADFKTWVMDMRLRCAWSNSYSWACRAADVWLFFAMEMEKPKELLAKVGKAKLALLVPLARRDEMSDELWDKALDEDVTVKDLADYIRELRGKPEKPEPKQIWINCPHCGNRFLASEGGNP